MNFKQSFYINLKLRDCLIHNSNLLIFCDGQASKQTQKHTFGLIESFDTKYLRTEKSFKANPALIIYPTHQISKSLEIFGDWGLFEAFEFVLHHYYRQSCLTW